MSSIKDLGVLVSSDLTWNPHVSYIIEKHTGTLGFSIELLDIATLLVQRKKLYNMTLIKSIILSYLVP